MKSTPFILNILSIIIFLVISFISFTGYGGMSDGPGVLSPAFYPWLSVYAVSIIISILFSAKYTFLANLPYIILILPIVLTYYQVPFKF